MNTIDKIKLLLDSSYEIKNLFNSLIPKWESNTKKFDKVRYGFCSGNTSGWYPEQEQVITFQAWAGTYGDSSTYRQFCPDGETFKRHFLLYLNSNKKSIMLAIAESIDAEAATMKEAAINELNSELLKLSTV